MIFLTVNKNFLLCGLIVLLILFSILDYICVYCFIKELKNYMFIKKLSKRKIEIVDAYDNEIIKLKKEINELKNTLSFYEQNLTQIKEYSNGNDVYKKIINEMEPYKIIYSIMNDIKKVTEKYESATDANDLRYFKEEINECVIDYNKRSKR